MLKAGSKIIVLEECMGIDSLGHCLVCRGEQYVVTEVREHTQIIIVDGDLKLPLYVVGEVTNE